MSILKSTLRTFFNTIAIFFGIAIAFILLALLFSSSPEKGSIAQIETEYAPFLLPDHNGSREEGKEELPLIFQLNIHGTIGIEGTTKEDIEAQLLESKEGSLKERKIAALLLHINSPGGSVDSSDGIYRAVSLYKERYGTPVYAYIDGMGFSGGYYAACSADKIFVGNVGMLGSVGVILAPFFNVSKVLDHLGIETKTLFAGKDKDLMNPLRPWKEGESAPLQHIIDRLYAIFVDIVVQARADHMTKEQLIAQGAAIFAGQEAVEVGMADVASASRESVLKAIADELKLEKYQVIEMQKKNWLKRWLEKSHSPLYGENTLTHQIDWGDGIPASLRGQPLYLHAPCYQK